VTPLVLVPITLREAWAFVARHHRHHKKSHKYKGGKFAIGVARDGVIVGVAITGRPKARLAADTWTAEVNRVCIEPQEAALRVVDEDGKEHASSACSKLYAASWRAARAMGYRKCITYSLPEESGASLRGAGWTCIGEAGGGAWGRDGRPRVDEHPTQTKLRWEIAA
jgi:hypothetical protein